MPLRQTIHKPLNRVGRLDRYKKPDPFYVSDRWRRLRRMVLAKHPICADPFNRHVQGSILAVDVDHKVPRLQRPDLELSVANLEALCHGCHSKKTRKEAMASRLVSPAMGRPSSTDYGWEGS